MATQPSGRQGNSNHAEQAADDYSIDILAPPQSTDARGNKRRLLQAAYMGDWEFAKKEFKKRYSSMTAKITGRSETVLHIAALSAQDQFVENLAELLSPDALQEVDRDGRTALHIAVLSQRIRMVKALVRRNPKLTQLADKEGCVPLELSAREAPMHKEIAWFLAKNTTDEEPTKPFSSPSVIDFILDLTYAGHHDIILYLVKRHHDLMTLKSRKHEGKTILYSLASMRSHFRSGTSLSVLEALIYKCMPVDLNYILADKNSDPGGYAYLLLGIILGTFMIVNLLLGIILGTFMIVNLKSIFLY